MVLVLDPLLEAVVANHKERALAPVMVTLERKLAQAFQAQGQRFLRGFGALRSRFAESAVLRETLTGDDWLRIFDTATGATTELFFGAIQDAARAALLLGAQNAIADVGIDSAFTLRNPRAEAYLQAHGYGLISQIDSVTRGNIATIVDEGVRAGWSYNATAREISRLYSEMAVGKPQRHIESRAHLIAVTEAGNAYEEGNAIVVRDLQDAGLRMEKKWLTVGDDRVSAGCRANEAEGWIPLERAHRSGHMQPLRFPGCRCTELYQRARTAARVAPVTIEPARPTAPTAAGVRQQVLNLDTAYAANLEQLDGQILEIAQQLTEVSRQIDRLEASLAKRAGTPEAAAIQAMLDRRRAERWAIIDGRRALEAESNRLGAERERQLRSLVYVTDPARVALWAPGQDAALTSYWQQGVDEFNRLVSAKVAPAERVLFLEEWRSDRSYYNHNGKSVNLTANSELRTVVHELGHWLEDQNADLRSKVLAFYKRRTEGYPLEQLGPAYGKDEMTRRDKFIDGYMGKEYEGATELVSMGIDHLYNKTALLAQRDPEMFDFIFDLVRGQ